MDELEGLLRPSAKAGYTHVLLSDSKLAMLGDMDARYFRTIKRVKKLGEELRLELVLAVFPSGYSNDLLWHDLNLIEARSRQQEFIRMPRVSTSRRQGRWISVRAVERWLLSSLRGGSLSRSARSFQLNPPAGFARAP